MDNSVRVSGLYVYPIKSCAGIELQQAEVLQQGLKLDRQWVVTTPDGKCITQRECPRLALVVPSPQNGTMTLSANTTGTCITIPRNSAPSPGALRKATVFGDVCDAVDEGDAAAAWLTAFLEIDCRLMRMAEGGVRTAVTADGQISTLLFADSYAVLMISEESLVDLNSRLDIPVTMDRFRPNIVIRNAGAYAEDSFTRLSIGEVEFAAAELCGRCHMTTVDQATGVKQVKEPLSTLSKYRKIGKKTRFGQYLFPTSAAPGIIRVGDTLSLF